MHQLFGELRKLPCLYCTRRNSFNSICVKRSQENIDLDVCESMIPNMDIIGPAIPAYFEYLDATKT